MLRTFKLPIENYNKLTARDDSDLKIEISTSKYTYLRIKIVISIDDPTRWTLFDKSSSSATDWNITKH